MNNLHTQITDLEAERDSIDDKLDTLFYPDEDVYEHINSILTLKKPKRFINSLSKHRDEKIIQGLNLNCSINVVFNPKCINLPYRNPMTLTIFNFTSKNDIVNEIIPHYKTRRDHHFIENISYNNGEFYVSLGS